ncbi:cyclin-D4-1 [Amborella trichopoda]|uniref:Cyclin-like domain-containing protein n=1 Tax=Amborella trichopoda TaxID=13333 RepID=U5CZ45_AMBTC|nr:cyclin-D4-1 [Amborella trichopoda]XP_020530834.1 cyclin-D4-1 [Amborella trichopoda]ERN18601.1 hypothetical protein AMTR_s00065p00148150 [Amborella trichopoda]|eukprot:XP_006857134.1 cyclin-D4-1 [Amborella trichopoda]
MAASGESLESFLCGEDAMDWDTSDDAWSSPIPATLPENSFLQVGFPDEPEADFVALLIDRETLYLPQSGYLERFRDRTLDASSRHVAINWILKVHTYYRFGPSTACLSVSYFDRFLSAHQIRHGNGWPFQLLSVACISLAAKMEETSVPSVLDLQVCEPKFIFDAKTVRRMELLVMAILKWRMVSVSPLSFVHYFLGKLDLTSKLEPILFNGVFQQVTEIILSTNRVIDFLGFRPSSIAAASVLCAAEGSLDFSPKIDALPSLFGNGVSQNEIWSCYNLMPELLVHVLNRASMVKSLKFRDPEEARIPQSPNGVLDIAACGSCDSQKSLVEIAGPPLKRPRLGDHCTEGAIDTNISNS